MTLNLNNTTELVNLGSRITELGAKRMLVVAERDEAVIKLKAIESELIPLIARHAVLIQEATGMIMEQVAPAPAPVSTAAPAQPLPDWAPASARLQTMLDADPAGVQMVQPQTQQAPAQQQRVPPQVSPDVQIKNRVKDFLRRNSSGESVSASDVAEALHVDSLLVREAMREMRTGR